MPPLAQYGKLPLYYAAANQAGPEVLVALLPAGVAARDSTNSYILLKEFAEQKAQVLAALLADVSAQERVEVSPEHADATTGGKENAHTFYSWTALVSETEDTCIHIVKAILNARKDHAQTLVNLRDTSGRRAIDM